MIKSMLDETDESIKNKYNQLNYIITLKTKIIEKIYGRERLLAKLRTNTVTDFLEACGAGRVRNLTAH